MLFGDVKYSNSSKDVFCFYGYNKLHSFNCLVDRAIYKTKYVVFLFHNLTECKLIQLYNFGSAILPLGSICPFVPADSVPNSNLPFIRRPAILVSHLRRYFS